MFSLTRTRHGGGLRSRRRSAPADAQAGWAEAAAAVTMAVASGAPAARSLDPESESTRDLAARKAHCQGIEPSL